MEVRVSGPTGDETPLAHGQVIKFEEILIKN